MSGVVSLRLQEAHQSLSRRCRQRSHQVCLRELNALLRLGLADHPLLDDFTFATRQLRAGETLVQPGDPCTAVYVVRLGSLRTVMIDAGGTEQRLGFPMISDVIGTAGLATGVHNSLTVALERSEVGIVPLSRIRELARALPAFETVLYRVVGREIVRDQALLYLLGSLNAEGRVAAFLLNLSERYGAMGYSRTTFNLRMTRHDIARYLGLTLETVSRAFSAYAASGVLSVEGRAIEILDMHALQRATTEPAAVLRGDRSSMKPLPPSAPRGSSELLAIAC